MKDRQKVWLWISAAFLFVVGFILVMSESSAGWFLIILGITYLGLSTRAGQTWSSSNPTLARWALLSVTLLLILLTIVVGAVLLMR
jgi:hypothetical protein